MPPPAPRLSPEEQRVLGALVEKSLATPDHYPLTRNALIAACNQSTNREPVVDYDERTVRAALDRLGERRLTRAASGPGSRAPKHRHLLRDALELGAPEQALLALLLLRGPQTAAELRQRSPRLHAFADAEGVDATLVALADRGLVADVGRRPGERGSRWAHLLHGEASPGPPPPPVAQADHTPDAGPAAGGVQPPPEAVAPLEHATVPDRDPDAPLARAVREPAGDARTDALEAEVATLREEVAGLRRALEELRGELGA